MAKEEDSKRNHQKKPKAKREAETNVTKGRKESVSWIGTSISKRLNHDKFEKDLNVSLKVSKAYCIEEEENARFKKSNFKAIVPQVIEKQNPDTLVLQTGSIEITNIDVNKALMDSGKHIEEYKKEWFAKVEEDSNNLFDIAKEALEKNVKKVIILKRLPRYNRSSSDLIGVKSQLSKFANSVYDQRLIQEGSPKNIIVLGLDLECSGQFRELVYGHHEDGKYDGIHLSGIAASRQFTYHTIKMLKAKVYLSLLPKFRHRQVANHQNSEQGQYQRTNRKPDNYVGSQSENRNRNEKSHSYAEAVK